MPPRCVPLALKDRLKEELARLEKSSVIVKEENLTARVEKPNGETKCLYLPSTS